MLPQLLFNGLIAGSVYAVIALGFGLIYSTVRVFHFAHGAIYTAGAYLAFFFSALLGMPFLIACFLAVTLASLLGMLTEVFIYRPLRNEGASSLALLIASLGLFILGQNLISMMFGDDTKALRSEIVQEGLNVWGARLTSIQVFTVSVSLILFALATLIFVKTLSGKILRAVANDIELAKGMGIDTDMMILGSFGIGSALAAVGAILVSLDVNMTPMMGFNALLMGVVAAIVGGIGSIPGALLGGLLVGMAQHLGVWKLPTQWQDAIVFIILILFLLFRPQGFLGKPLRKAAV